MPETSIEPATEGEDEIVLAVFYWQDEPDYEYAWWWKATHVQTLRDSKFDRSYAR